uniref:DUF985 domain-containing protein n=1 Tax=Palpitomonas bilix TaxID=652834 RepID=A0A7S3LUT1_9EUKA|mmetsp:Transcript_4817/g.10121  ORF Transcript_4817/g.10121 Transcript_4817/m.10121 type:complete len:178 (+) Transcript_4817:233-766(+)
MEKTKIKLIERLKLSPHPEGGFYKRVYEGDFIPGPAFSLGEQSKRHYSTHIYYCLGHGDVSTFHKLRSDELWNFYSGRPIYVVEIDPVTKREKKTKLGNDFEAGEVPFYVVAAGRWFGSFVVPDSELPGREDFALVGCTVSPGFDFEDFVMAKREKMKEDFPSVSPQLIDKMTHPEE